MRWIWFTIMLVATTWGCADGRHPVTPGLPDGGPTPDADEGPCAQDPCFPGVGCTNTEAGFECGPCPTGREGDGITCTEVDGCEGNPCAAGVTCTDAPAPSEGFECGECPSGREGDGITCTEIDGCASDPCAPEVTCNDIPAPGTGYTCDPCPAGYEGDGKTCTDIDGCAQPGVCFPGVACTDVPAPSTGATCGPCPSGYDGDGTFCELLCEAELDLGCGSSITSTTAGLGSQDLIDDWECATSTLTGRELIFSFTAPSAGIAAVSITGLEADLDLLVLEDTGGICNPMDSLACVPGGYSDNLGTDSELVRWDTTAGTTYYVVVDGYNGATSSFNLQIGTAAGDVLLNEISAGTIDFVEIRNHGACPVNAGNFTLFHAPSCEAPYEFTFPAVSIPALGVFRAMDDNWVSEANEVGWGDACELADDIGHTTLCFGQTCDPESTCNNILDYVERDGDLDDEVSPVTPACVGFSPGPVDVSSADSGTSVRRADFTSSGQTFQRDDWTLGTPTFE